MMHGMGRMGGTGMQYAYSTGFFGLSWNLISMLIFWLLASLVVFFLIKYFVTNKEKKYDALEVLRIRLAKGEISEEEYLKLKDILSK